MELNVLNIEEKTYLMHLEKFTIYVKALKNQKR